MIAFVLALLLSRLSPLRSNPDITRFSFLDIIECARTINSVEMSTSVLIELRSLEPQCKMMLSGALFTEGM